MPGSTNEPRNLVRRMSFGLITVVVGLLAPLLLAEVVCRFLPVAIGGVVLPVNAQNPIFRFAPDRDYVWSVGWRFSIVNRGRINNDGFVNDQDYYPDEPGPLLAVIGDSYVEALMVPYRETLHARLQACIANKGRVYSFGASGAPLSQYLVWADYARERYAADAMAFVIVGNDFDESLSKYATGPGFHHFSQADDGALRLRRYDYAPSTLGKIVYRSALLRYLLFNLHADVALATIWKSLLQPAQADGTPQHVGNTAARASEQRLEDSEQAVLAFLAALEGRAGLDAERIVFLIDGIRPQLYGGQQALNAVGELYFPRMREFFMREARKRGFHVIDLQPPFVSRHLVDGAVFEFTEDAHWNGLGHEVAAQTLARNEAVRELFSMDSEPDRVNGFPCPASH